MILYLITRLSSIGCEKKYEDILQNNNILDEIQPFFINLLLGLFSLIFIIIFFSFFLKNIKENLLNK